MRMHAPLETKKRTTRRTPKAAPDRVKTFFTAYQKTFGDISNPRMLRRSVKWLEASKLIKLFVKQDLRVIPASTVNEANVLFVKPSISEYRDHRLPTRKNVEHWWTELFALGFIQGELVIRYDTKEQDAAACLALAASLSPLITKIVLDGPSNCDETIRKEIKLLYDISKNIFDEENKNDS